MAGYNANINITVSGQSRLDYVLASVEKLNTIVSRLKPINILAPGAGAGGDAIRQAKKQLDDFARAVVNFEPQGIQKRAKELSNTLAGSAAQADSLAIALANVGLKSGGFKKQATEVQNYARALDTAARNAERVGMLSAQVQRGARIENIAMRFGVSPESIEQRINNLRDIRYKKQRQAAAEEYMQQKRAEDFELRLNKILERRAGLQRQQETNKRALSEGLIGGAFPLLFGQGLGASIGGGLGGAIGGAKGGGLGFGLSLLGTGLGSAFDQVIVSAQDFAKSLREGGNAAGYLENKLGILDPTIKKQISNLQNSGQTAAAAELAFDQLAQQLGEDGARAFLEAGKNTDSLSRSLKLVIDRFVAAGFAANKYFEELKYGKGGSFTDFLPPQLRPAPAPQAPATTSAFKERSAELGRETEALRVQLELTSVSAKTELDRYVTLSRSAAQKEYENRLAEIAIQLKNKEISLEQNKQLITNANLQLAIKLGEIERSRIQEVQRRNQEAAQAAERAARAAEQAAKEQTRAYQESLQLQNQLSQTVLEEYSILAKGIDVYKGAIAGYEKSNILLAKQLALQEEILNYELAIARTSDAYATNQDTVEAIYATRLSNLRLENDYLKSNLTIQKERAVLEQTIAMTELARQNNRRRVAGQTEIDRLTTQLESPFGGEQMERQLLFLDQYTRRMDELLPIQERIKDLQRDIALAAQTPGLFTEDQVSAAKAELTLQTEQLNELQAELQLRDRLEQQLLRQQEIYARYGFIADEVSQALSDSITGLITGTTTVAEAFSRMFANIGKAFIDMATQMLAQKLIFSLFGSLLGGLGGGGGGGGLFSGQGPAQLPGGAGFAQGFSLPKLYAEGGFVTGPTRALIGEGGEPEYVIPASKMRSAMSRYAAGARGASVIPTSGQTESSDTSAVTSGPIDVRYTVERINNVEYVTADQFRAGMQQAAAQGAQRGEQRALRSLQQSTAIRSRVGIK